MKLEFSRQMFEKTINLSVYTNEIVCLSSSSKLGKHVISASQIFLYKLLEIRESTQKLHVGKSRITGIMALLLFWHLIVGIVGFRCGLPEICRLLGCYAAQVGFAPTFRDYVSVPSRVKMYKKGHFDSNMGPILSPETSMRNLPTLCCISEDNRIRLTITAGSVHNGTSIVRAECT